MPDIPITDVAASADLKLADDAPLAKAKLSHILSATKSFLSQFEEPIDQAQICSASLGFTVTAPSELVAKLTTLTVKSGVNGSIAILKPKDHNLFSDDGFIPAVAIASNECWVGVQLETTVAAKLAATANGFGVCVAESSAVKSGTYTRFPSLNGTFPSLKACVEQSLNNYCVLHSPETVRTQKPDTILVTEAIGTVKFTGSYKLPVNVSAFASAQLPFGANLNLTPEVTMKVTGEIALSGSFRIRCLKLQDEVVQLALCKEKGTELSVGFTAGVGVESDIGETDLIAALLGAVLPSVDPKQAGLDLTGEKADPIRDVLKKSIDRSLAISINTLCSAELTDETAVAYTIHLNAGNANDTDAAVAAALAGNWSKLAALPNATCIRDVATHTHEYKNCIAINLLGFYNASSVNSYLKSSTVLHDENGRIFVTDKATASRIATAATPYLADAERLSRVLAETNLASITYAATASHVETQVKIRQQYLSYDKNMTRQEMQDEILFGAALGLMQVADWKDTLAANAKFGHARVSATAEYDHSSALSVFLADVQQRTCRTNQKLTAIGRRTLAALINPDDPEGKVRRDILANDAIWADMDKNGNMHSFSTISGLSRLSSNQVAAVAGDWASVRWWADAVFQLAPKLVDVLNSADQTTPPDPTANPVFMKKREALLTALQDVTGKTHAAFNEGWGMAVMSALAQSKPTLSMDIDWASKTKHYESMPQVAAAGSSQT